MASLHDSCMKLDIFAAIHAHVQWKQRLLHCINGETDEKLDPKQVGSDHQCELGKWLHGSGAEKYSDYPSFDSLKAIHADFHHLAADIVKAAHRGDREGALLLLNHGEYPKVSNRVKSILAAMSLSSDFDSERDNSEH